jgi:hypothetical protein
MRRNADHISGSPKSEDEVTKDNPGVVEISVLVRELPDRLKKAAGNNFLERIRPRLHSDAH